MLHRLAVPLILGVVVMSSCGRFETEPSSRLADAGDVREVQSCGYPTFTAPSQVRLTKPRALLVTHASRGFDTTSSTKPGLDRVVRRAKDQGLDVVYLQERDPYTADLYFYGDCRPTYFVNSEQGEFSFPLETRDVITVGGFFELCKNRSVQQVLRSWGERYASSGQSLRLTEVLDASYKTPFGSGTVASMLQPMSQAERLSWARNYLQTFSSFFPAGYRIVMEWNGAFAGEIRPGTGPQPTLTVNFAMSADQAFGAALPGDGPSTPPGPTPPRPTPPTPPTPPAEACSCTADAYSCTVRDARGAIFAQRPTSDGTCGPCASAITRCGG